MNGKGKSSGYGWVLGWGYGTAGSSGRENGEGWASGERLDRGHGRASGSGLLREDIGNGRGTASGREWVWERREVMGRGIGKGRANGNIWLDR